MSKPPPPLLGLVMVVKNEAEQIERCLESVRPYIDYWTICDTGSTDDTEARVRASLKEIPGVFRHHEWANFGHNLTLAHRAARSRSRWMLWLHADMVVAVDDAFLPWLRRQRTKLDALSVAVADGVRTYRLPLIMRSALDWRYVGATHEYLARADGKLIVKAPLNGFGVFHFADGANRPEKAERDLELMKPGLIAGDPRDTFYTAETYRFTGRTKEAIHCYRIRERLDGFEEERWYSSYQIAVLTGDFDALFEVWRERPWRHEPLTAMGRLIAEQNPTAGGDVLFLEPPP
jgi:glycosyltransferase involved in cell wall biosynthesis